MTPPRRACRHDPGPPLLPTQIRGNGRADDVLRLHSYTVADATQALRRSKGLEASIEPWGSIHDGGECGVRNSNGKPKIGV